MTKQLKVLELFAGVGGFRIGLENSNKQLYKTCWANQWEPARKSQDAFEVYNYRFPDSENIGYSVSDISDEHFAQMDVDIIVGGLPYYLNKEKIAERLAGNDELVCHDNLSIICVVSGFNLADHVCYNWVWSDFLSCFSRDLLRISQKLIGLECHFSDIV